MDWYIIFFYLALSFFTMHEMDAVRCKKWRIFPRLSSLSDKWGYFVFIIAHIPIFFFIYNALVTLELKHSCIPYFNVFLIFHTLLHVMYLKHQKNLFKDWVSWVLIVGVGLSGIFSLYNGYIISLTRF